MSVYALFRMDEKETVNDIDDFIRDFCLRNVSNLYLWGEASIPQILAYYWYLRKIDSTKLPDSIIGDLISRICTLNHPRKGVGLANPYYEFTDILSYNYNLAEQPLEDTFRGNSYMLEGLVHLLVRRNWKQKMKLLWPDVTRLSISTYLPDKKWHFYRWKNERKGILKTQLPKHRQHWDDLKALAYESKGSCIPRTIKNYPVLAILLIIVYPHRMNSEVIRWLDTELERIQY